MKWSTEAERAMARVPFFVRHRVKRKVEEEAAGRGDSVVLFQHVRDCRRRYLDGMEHEVRGFQVETCFGPGGCPNRVTAEEGVAEMLEDLLRGKDLRGFLHRTVKGPLRLHHEFRISVSDCPNGCSRPQIADVGLLGACRPTVLEADRCTRCGACAAACREKAVSVADDVPVVDPALCLLCGQCTAHCPQGLLARGKQGFRIQLGGKLGRHPRLGRELEGVHSLEETLIVVERCIDFYMKHCREGERFGEVLERVALEF